MATGAALTQAQVDAAIAFNNQRHAASWITLAAVALKYPSTRIPSVDEVFVRLVADFQEAALGSGTGDGKIGPKTEAYIGIIHPKALHAVAHARSIQAAGGILFDSWGNDLRDNDNDAEVDGRSEQGKQDGYHYGGTYRTFAVFAGSYPDQGWGHNRTVTVPTSQIVVGSFKYRVCADIVSLAYHKAAVMPTTRSTAVLLQKFRDLGYVWRKSDGYPPSYLPGDFICTLGHGGGHSGIVVEATSTQNVPKVIELPGPSTMVDEGTYNPAQTNDVRLGLWTKRFLTDGTVNYLGRLLCSKLR